MPEIVIHGLGLLIQILETCGAGALILGFGIATWKWIQRLRREGQRTALGPYRQALGRSVLIGLEVLVAATIVIRTILGWTTILEISGRWPWQKTQARPSEP